VERGLYLSQQVHIPACMLYCMHLPASPSFSSSPPVPHPLSFDSHYFLSIYLHTFILVQVAIKTLRDSTHEKSNADFMTEIAINKLLPSTVHQYKQNQKG
jgi:hypothetical protein